MKLDWQSTAYRDMSPLDVIDDVDLSAMTGVRHAALDPDVSPAVALRLPEDFERMEWDHGRTDPRAEAW